MGDFAADQRVQNLDRKEAMRPIALEHIVGFTMGCLFLIIGAIYLGYAARGWSYAVAGLLGMIFATGGFKVVRLVIGQIDERRTSSGN